MEKGYFAAAWGDVTKSPGWASTLIRLGLLCLIPVFGVMVLYGYLYSWARDISWNVHRPLPKKIFANEDGGLYRRGFFILVITVAFTFAASLLSSFTPMLSGLSFAGGSLSDSFAPIMLGAFFWMAGTTVSLALSLLAMLFSWVGSMRTSLYGTLSAGFQIGKIWAMMRHDFIGLLRILGMNILIGVAVLVGAFALVALLVLLLSGFALLASFGIPVDTIPDEALVIAALVIGACAFIVALLFASALQSALTIRALGYWTRQFEVSQWRGQEDPMPFEQNACADNGQAPLSSNSVSNAGSRDASDPTAEEEADTSKPA